MTMHARAFRFRNEKVGGLLDARMLEFVDEIAVVMHVSRRSRSVPLTGIGIFSGSHDQAILLHKPQMPCELLPLHPGDQGKRVKTEAVAQSCSELEQFLRVGFKLPDILSHQFDDVVGDRHHLNLRCIPFPAPGDSVKFDQARSIGRMQQLPDEERYTMCFCMNQLG